MAAASISPSEKTPLVDGKNLNGTNDPENPPNPASNKINKNDDKNKGAYRDVEPSWGEVMEKVTPHIRPADSWHTFCAVVALISLVIGKIIGILPPLAIKYAVDTISEEPTSAKPIIYAILAYCGLKVLGMINSAGQDLAQRTVALDAERRFAVTTFAHLHTLSLSYHLEKHIGEITRIMNRGSDSVGTIISSFLFYLAPTFIEAIIVSAVFWKLGTPTVALSTFVAVIAYLSFTVLVTKTRITFRRKLIEASDKVGQKETETLVNFETVTMFGRSGYEIRQYSDLRQDYKNKRVDMLGLFAVLEAGQRFIRLCGTGAGLVIAGMATVYGYGPDKELLSPGSFVVIQIYIEQLFSPLSQLGWQYRMITQAFTDLEKAVTMLNRRPEVEDIPGAEKWIPQPRLSGQATGEITLTNVSFHYKVSSQQRALGSALNEKASGKGVGRHGLRRGRAFAGLVDEGVTKNTKKTDSNEEEGGEETVELGGVSNVTLTVPAGKTTALVGASGSGKTTLIRLVLRMYDPDEGTIQVDGRDIKQYTQESLRQNIGVVAQDTILFNATLRENITYGKEHATEEEVWDAVRTSALESFVMGLPEKLDTLVGERGMKLSGGERQRVGLARCLIKDPQLVLLDEATSALDSATEREIQKNIATVCDGRTTLMIAHRLSTARHADEIVVLEKGEIVEKGSHDELLAKEGRYAKMWNLQTGQNED